jgi:hypothetical protein
LFERSYYKEGYPLQRYREKTKKASTRSIFGKNNELCKREIFVLAHIKNGIRKDIVSGSSLLI